MQIVKALSVIMGKGIIEQLFKGRDEYLEEVEIVYLLSLFIY